MLTHGQIWTAIDRIAADHDMTPSGLAKRAGLDPTAFNKSKRIGKDAKPRWPSTESIAKILEALNIPLSDFLGRVDPTPTKTGVPLIGFAQAGAQGFFDDAGYPVGGGWDEIQFPNVGDSNAYALEISGDSMEPTFRAGDFVIVSPNASIRRGDRVVVKTTAGEVMVKELVRQSTKWVELMSINPDHPGRILPAEEVLWVARIVWASQ